MKLKNVLLQSDKKSNPYMSSAFSMRNLLRNFVVTIYFSLICVLIFKITATPASPKEIINVAWKFLLVGIIIRITTASIRMIQSTYYSYIFTSVFLLLYLGYSIFLVAYLGIGHVPTNYTGIYKIIYYSFPIIGVEIIWGIAYWMLESKSNPFVAVAKVFNSFLFALLVIVMLFVNILIHDNFLPGHTKSFDAKDPETLTLIIAIIILSIAGSIASFILYRKAKKRNLTIGDNRNLSFSIAVLAVIPLSIWLISKFFVWTSGSPQVIYLLIMIAIVLIATVFTINRKTELASPRIFVVVISAAFVGLWGVKFFYEFYYGDSISSVFTSAITLMGHSAITLLVYLKNPKVSQGISKLYKGYAYLVAVVSMIMFVVGSVGIPKGVLPFDVGQIINTITVITPALLLVVSMATWLFTQYNLKRHVKIKDEYLKSRLNKKEKKKIKIKLDKEVAHE